MLAVGMMLVLLTSTLLLAQPSPIPAEASGPEYGASVVDAGAGTSRAPQRQNAQAASPFDRNAAEDWNGLSHPRTGGAEGIWSDGTTMWIADITDHKLYAYDMATQARVPAEDFDTLKASGNTRLEDIWSDGVTMWVADDSAKLFAYDMETKARDPDEDFNTLRAAGNTGPEGIWSDGATMWVADHDHDKLFAYDLSNKDRTPDEDFNTLSSAGNNWPIAIWSDGETMWVSDWTDDKLYAYDMATKDRAPSLDFNTLSAAGNNAVEGIWSDGTTMWVRDNDDRKMYAYHMPAVVTSSAILPFSQWTLMGAAQRTDAGSVVLTPAQTYRIGYLLHPNPVSSTQFSVAFSFEIEGGSGADGLAMVIAPNFPDVASPVGCGGCLGSPQMQGAVAVGFDTWRNTWDTSGNHVEISILGEQDPRPLAAENLAQNLSEGGIFDVEILFDHGAVSVYLSNASQNMSRTLVLSHTIPDFEPFEAYIGFVATTGAYTDRHIIHDAVITISDQPAPSAGSEDYDVDDDGLIEVSNLVQLDAIRYDLNGDGAIDDPNMNPPDYLDYFLAYPDAADGMGCPAAGCTGYELTAHLDFDTNGNGWIDSKDAYWNDGQGWLPIGNSSDPFTATFDGGGYTIANLHINRSRSYVGLFGAAGDSAVIRRVGLVSGSVSGDSRVGSLAGHNSGDITDSYATGTVTGHANQVGGLEPILITA